MMGEVMHHVVLVRQFRLGLSGNVDAEDVLLR